MNDRLQEQPKAADTNTMVSKSRPKAAGIRLVALVSLMSMVILLMGFVTTKTTYEIHDEDTVQTVVSYSDDLQEAYTRAGIELSATDKVTTQSQGNTVYVYIARARKISLTVDGITQNTIAYNQTVSELLEQQKITVDDDDLLSVALDASLEDGMSITVTHRTVTVEETSYTIDYETQLVANAELERGVEVIKQAGVAGQGVSSVEVISYGNGTEERNDLGNTVVSEPVNEIIEYGTKVNQVALSSLSVTANAIVAIDDTGSTQGGVLTLTDGTTLNYTSVMSANATAYYAGSCGKSASNPAYGITATGTRASVGTVAVDPSMIPYGTKMYIVSSDGSIVYGIATAEDCGGSIKGNRIDLYYNTANECFSFGRRNVTIYFIAS